MTDLLKGKVIKSTGSWYNVLIEKESAAIPCRIVGKFRLKGKSLTNPVAVGDEVKINLEEDGSTGMIKEILPRRNCVIRQSPRKKHNLHLIAANIDQAIVIMTIREPKLKQGFIDRFILMTEPYNIPVVIVFNKSDLYDEDDLIIADYLKGVYERIGYHVIICSALEATGIEELKHQVKDKTSLMAGQSGVGKSSVINAIEPGLGLKTKELSDFSGKGQHTTTFAEMFELKIGGYIIDTPGIKTLSFNNLEVMDVAHNFREFFALSPDCKYPDCTHRNEPKCAVKDAIESGEISELRYANYIQILEEIEEQNYWERHKHM